MSESSRFDASVFMEGVFCVFMAATLSKLNLLNLPQGGSVDLELVPLMIFAWRHGMAWGSCAGAMFGIVKILLGGYIRSPIQAFIDYPLAYSTIGLVAIFPDLAQRRTVGIIVAAFGEIACKLMTGAIVYGRYAPYGQSPWAYSIAYHAPGIALKFSISGAISILLMTVYSFAVSAMLSRGSASRPSAPASPDQ